MGGGLHLTLVSKVGFEGSGVLELSRNGPGEVRLGKAGNGERHLSFGRSELLHGLRRASLAPFPRLF